MVYVPGGTFTMGRTNSGLSKDIETDDELPAHSVTLNSFYIGKYQVTQGEYQAVMGSNPASSYGVGSNYPVYYVSWYDAITYCN
ncbi:MAG: formylglycine-generating enzyme family protein, partial [Candidatus Cloacimonetes bacterium]|nr:formylglycine-generating enzyme family protein [Candidatus Cloacimonadota bacterium]